MWERAIGNELALSNSTFEKALQRSRDLDVRLAKPGEQEPCRERSWYEAIHRDLKATFPELKIFQPGSSLHSDLADVLKAYCMYRSDVGYCHGTHVSPLRVFPITVTLTLPPAPRRPPRPYIPHPLPRLPRPLQPPQPSPPSRLPNRRPHRHGTKLPTHRRPARAQTPQTLRPPLHTRALGARIVAPRTLRANATHAVPRPWRRARRGGRDEGMGCHGL